MIPKSNNNRFKGFGFSLSKGLLLAALIHVAVGLLFLYRQGHIENFISRYRIFDSALQSRHQDHPRGLVKGVKKRIPKLSSDKPLKSPEGASGYQIDIHAFQKEDVLFVKGWVGKGPPCDMLEIGMDLICETGKNVFLRVALEKVGGSGSRLISRRRWVGRVQGKSYPQWSASVAYVSCLAD